MYHIIEYHMIRRVLCRINIADFPERIIIIAKVERALYTFFFSLFINASKRFNSDSVAEKIMEIRRNFSRKRYNNGMGGNGSGRRRFAFSRNFSCDKNKISLIIVRRLFILYVTAIYQSENATSERVTTK